MKLGGTALRLYATVPSVIPAEAGIHGDGRPGLPHSRERRPAPQSLDGDAERARLAVTKRVKAAIKRIAEHDAALGHHLATTIKTGQQWAYLPDPAQPAEWEG